LTTVAMGGKLMFWDDHTHWIKNENIWPKLISRKRLMISR
jgi:hypothetical protein